MTSDRSILLKKLTQLRKSMGLNKRQFAAELSVSRIALNHWETGLNGLDPSKYILLARLAHKHLPSSAWWFWQQAGLEEDDVQRLVDCLGTKNGVRHEKQS
jgi:transcriptional regulator with XRE-family HTH domain